MKGLDTNVLIEWLYGYESIPIDGGDDRFRIAHVVLVEMVWVLERSLKRKRSDIVSVLEAIVRTDQFVIDNEPVVVSAIVEYSSGPADFADYLLMKDNEAARFTPTLTFDRKAARHPGFQLLEG